MSVLIKGMSFPTKENFMTQLYLICDKDGDWYAVDTTNKDLYKLIEVKEPHGRLGDLDKLMAEFMDSDLDHLQRDDWKEVIQIVADAPTVIEAEGSEA